MPYPKKACKTIVLLNKWLMLGVLLSSYTVHTNIVGNCPFLELLIYHFDTCSGRLVRISQELPSHIKTLTSQKKWRVFLIYGMPFVSLFVCLFVCLFVFVRENGKANDKNVLIRNILRKDKQIRPRFLGSRLALIEG